MRVLLVFLMACTSSDPSSPPAPSGPRSAPRPPPARWELVLGADYGPCAPSDARSCHTTWTVHADGVVAKLALPNDPRKLPVATTTTLSSFDRDGLRALVARAEFRDGMTKGFACQGEAHDPDATLRLTFVDPPAPPASQAIEHCTHGSGAEQTLPSQILGLIRR